MATYTYRLLNVFTVDGNRLSGNPLCVFEDARGLDDRTMQALALQFNLSETTFILPSECATARVRIFTPSFEMRFAGHPTLGTAQVVRSINNLHDHVTLEMQIGVIPVSAHANTWTLQAKPPTWRNVEATQEQLAAMLGLQPSDIGMQPLWVNTGSEQLVIPVSSADAVARSHPRSELLTRYAKVDDKRFLVYVWSSAGESQIIARFFFNRHGACVEDAATGSACANLGGWFIATNAQLPIAKQVLQGEAVGRPSKLGLRVSAQQEIYVSGKVIELGRGAIEL